jgi:uncharacterized protein (DUF305 family)
MRTLFITLAAAAGIGLAVLGARMAPSIAGETGGMPVDQMQQMMGHGGIGMGGMGMGGMGGMGGMDMDGMGGPKGDDGPSSLAFQGANNKMHKAMAIVFTGNADVDFASGMIPHHQGAIDMAKIELAFGTDPELKKLAEDIVAAQEKEIAFMRAWLEKNRK